MSEYLEDLREGNAPTNAFYGLTTKGYENLSQNMAEVTRYIRQVLSIIEYYRRVDSEQEEENENE
jgi:predicted transcriptional regulator